MGDTRKLFSGRQFDLGQAQMSPVYDNSSQENTSIEFAKEVFYFWQPGPHLANLKVFINVIRGVR